MSKRRALSGKAQCALWLFLLLIPFFLFPPSNLIAQPAGDFNVFVDDYGDADFGDTIEVPISYENNSDLAIGGFELMISYGTEGLIFNGVEKGSALENCNWGYFRYHELGGGFLRISAVAFTGSNNPDCYLANSSGELARMSFIVKNDTTILNDQRIIRFYWFNCADNSFSNIYGDTIFISDSVWSIPELHTGGESLPTIEGAPDSCLMQAGRPVPILRFIDFWGNTIIIDNYEDPPLLGDINVNLLAFEIADYVLFSQWFLYGDSIFNVNFEKQSENSDCNGDGLILTLRDLVYLFRVIIGDAVPPPPSKRTSIRSASALVIQDTLNRNVTVIHGDSLSGVFLKFDGEIVPDYNGPMDFGYGYLEQDTRILIIPGFSGSQVHKFEPGQILSYSGEGVLYHAELADFEDSHIPVTIVYSSSELICGDINQDGSVAISDAVYLINWIFSGGPAPGFMEIADVNCDGMVNLPDIIYIIRFAFNNGAPPCADCPM